jgi:hypothetical protein
MDEKISKYGAGMKMPFTMRVCDGGVCSETSTGGQKWRIVGGEDIWDIRRLPGEMGLKKGGVSCDFPRPRRYVTCLRPISIWEVLEVLDEIIPEPKNTDTHTE